jgi:ectoine hydroxylase-related dioxygenase (phytanoyl-CoA dioxygenase family)
MATNASTAEASWQEDGFLLLPGVLDGEEVGELRSDLDLFVEQVRAEAADLSDQGRGHTTRIRAALGRTALLDGLLDHPRLLPKLTQLLHSTPTLLSSEVFYRSPEPSPMVKFHTDGGPLLQRLNLDPRECALQVKVQVFLTDVRAPNSGNFMAIRGSHVRRPERVDPGCYLPEANEYLDRGELPPETVQVCAKAGDALIFPFSLWHAVAPNETETVRKSAILRFGQPWCRPHDSASTQPGVIERMTAERRRILGWRGEGEPIDDVYKPLEVDDYWSAGAARSV